MSCPYYVGQAVAAMVSGGLVNATVTEVIARGDGSHYVLVSVPAWLSNTWFIVGTSGQSDYLLPRPIRPTVNDDRVTPDTRYTVQRAPEGAEAPWRVSFEGRVLKDVASEADGWSLALDHSSRPYPAEGGNDAAL